MGFFLANDVARAPIRGLSSPMQKYILIRLAQFADDSDEGGRHAGGNIYPSMNRIADLSGYRRASVHDSVSALLDSGWIREHETSKYLNASHPGRRPSCYEINLSMLARVIDAEMTITHYGMKKDQYENLLNLAVVPRDDDWEKRLWFREYQARVLDIDKDNNSFHYNLWNRAPVHYVHYSNGSTVKKSDLAEQWEKWQEEDDSEAFDPGYVEVEINKGFQTPEKLI